VQHICKMFCFSNVRSLNSEKDSGYDSTAIIITTFSTILKLYPLSKLYHAAIVQSAGIIMLDDDK